MDKSESPSQVEDEKVSSAPGSRRPVWVMTFAVLALAGAVISLASLRGSTPASTPAAAPASVPAVDLAALSQQSPLALPLANALNTASVAQAAAPVQQVAAAAPAGAVAPAAAPAAGTQSGPMAMSSTGGSSCVSKDMLSAFWAHVEAAHLDESLGQQASDLLNLDSWVKLHTVWIDTVLKPALASSASSDTLSAFWAHVEAAHLNESLGQQVSDLLNVDGWVKLHTVWLDTVLKPAIDQLSC